MNAIAIGAMYEQVLEVIAPQRSEAVDEAETS